MTSSSLAETDYKSHRAGQMLEAHERRHHILDLRRRGMTYQQISETLADREALSAAGLNWEPITVDASSCARIVKRYLHQLELEESETRDELRQLENSRLDAMMRKWLPRQDSGDPTERARAAAVLLRISERRAKLNGLDAPTKVNVNFSGSIMHELGVNPEEIEREKNAFLTAFGGEPETIEGTFEELTGGSPEDS